MSEYSNPQWWYGDLNDNKLHLVRFAEMNSLCGKRVTYSWMGGDPAQSAKCPECVKILDRVYV